MIAKPHQKTLVTFLIVIGLAFTFPAPSSGQETQEEECTGLYKGEEIRPEILSAILEEHKVWLESGKRKGKRANLCGADLGPTLGGGLQLEANLRGANLGEANLSEAYLQGNLTEVANLTQAQIDQACVDVFTILPEGLTLPEPCADEENGEEAK